MKINKQTRNQKIIEDFLGLTPGVYTAKELNLSRERIRQIIYQHFDIDTIDFIKSTRSLLRKTLDRDRINTSRKQRYHNEEAYRNKNIYKSLRYYYNNRERIIAKWKKRYHGDEEFKEKERARCRKKYYDNK